MNSYLLRDILAYEGIRKSDKILNLLKLLAYQVGQEVSVSELAKNLSSLSRNTIIRNFHPLQSRNDQGLLWENYLMAERLKYLAYNKRHINRYFWRTYDLQEIDLIEEENGQLSAYEFKWNQTKKAKKPGAWAKHYEKATFEIISPKNYLDFIS